MQNAINAIATSNNGNGILNVQFGCGTYDYREPLIGSHSNIIIKGQEPFGIIEAGIPDGCIIFKPVGNTTAILYYNSASSIFNTGVMGFILMAQTLPEDHIWNLSKTTQQRSTMSTTAASPVRFNSLPSIHLI